MDSASLVERYTAELVDRVIPFWEAHGIDRIHGGFHTSLDRDGSVYDTEKYMWMQWRAVYTWATLALTPHAGDKKAAWLDHARQGFEFLHAHGRDEQGMYYFVISQDGTPVVSPYNIFTEAFAVMGSAALFKATGEGKFRNAALDAMDHYLARVDDPKGRWNKRLPGAPQRSSHGTHMILANLGTVVKDCLGVSRYDPTVREAIDTVVHRFWNGEHVILFENLGADFSVDLASSDGRHVNPGHGLESAWFVLQHAEREKRPDLVPVACKIITSLLEFGWDKEHGGVFYFMDVLGKPHPELSWDMKLWWVHCEALVATAMAYRMTGDTAFKDWFTRVDEWTWSRFPDPDHGEWFGYLNRRGEPTHVLKGGRWKGFFHLPRALLACIDEIRRWP